MRIKNEYMDGHMERVSFGDSHTSNNIYSRKVPNYLPCNTNPVIYY